MANQKSATASRARFKRNRRKRADRGTSQHGNGGEAATYEQELAHYLQERIKPGLNRGSIALQARSIAKEIAHRRPDEDADVAGDPSNEEHYEVRGEADSDVSGEADDDEEEDVEAEAADVFSNEEDGNDRSLEDEMRDLQANLGDDWILRVSVQGEHAWLTAEKDDRSQRVEAPAAHVLAEVVVLLKERGGRGSARARSRFSRSRSGSERPPASSVDSA
jgi:hypothetical protein